MRLIPTKRDIAFVEFVDEGSAGVAKDALHNYKLDGENKIKVRLAFPCPSCSKELIMRLLLVDHVCQEIKCVYQCMQENIVHVVINLCIKAQYILHISTINTEELTYGPFTYM